MQQITEFNVCLFLRFILFTLCFYAFLPLVYLARPSALFPCFIIMHLVFPDPDNRAYSIADRRAPFQVRQSFALANIDRSQPSDRYSHHISSRVQVKTVTRSYVSRVNDGLINGCILSGPWALSDSITCYDEEGQPGRAAGRPSPQHCD